MDDDKDKNSYNQEVTVEEKTFSTKLYSYFYQILDEKKETSILEIYILLILEIIQIISYAFAPPHLTVWKIKSSIIEKISNITGIFRISQLMIYVQFNIYIIIFFILVIFIFVLCLAIIMQILFGKPESKLFMICLTATRVLYSPLTIFLYIPITELILLPLKCVNGKIDIVKDSMTCWSGLHFLYIILGIIASLLFLCALYLLTTFYFSPFNYNESTIKINSFVEVIYLISKFIFVLRFILIKNDYLSIVILLLLSLYILIEEFNENSYNYYKLELMINIRNSLFFWTFFVLLIAKICQNSNINGIIYLLLFGYPVVIICCVLLFNNSANDFNYSTASFNNVQEYLNKTRLLIKLIDSFIEGSKNIRYGAEGSNQKNDILLKGIIKIHTETCLNPECPLTKFIQNPGNYNIQKQCLLNYMTIYFNLGIKKFPQSRKLMLFFIQFNFSKRFNLNSVRTNLSILQKLPNNYHDNFVIFCLSQEIKTMRNKNLDSNEANNMEQEIDLISQKYQRLKYLIEDSTKLYGEFWGIFATNVTNNLNTLKLYNLGQKLNLYLNEINNLWDIELKSKKIETDNQSIVQLYSRFLKEILWNKKKSEEITKKLNDEHQRHHENKKRVDENLQRNNIDAALESPDFVIYATSNEKGDCKLGQCSSSIVNLMGYMKSEIIGKNIEVLMPKIFVDGHAAMLSETIKRMHSKQNSQRNSYGENDKKTRFIVSKSKMGYLIPLNSKFTIYEDNDFSNSFIVKAQMEAKDTKSVYAYYILTKNDFTVDTISSSAINLGLSMDLLNKYVIQMNFLTRDDKDQTINFNDVYTDYEEEPKEVTWVYPDIIYPKKENNNNKNKIIEEDINELINKSKKMKLHLQISVMKYNDEEILGFVFKFTEINKKKKSDEIILNNYVPHTNKEILFDMMSLNYIRTILVEEKTGKNNWREKDVVGEGDKVGEKNNLGSEKKHKKNENYDNIQESSDEEEKKSLALLTKEKLLELQPKDSKEIQNFIMMLPFYGSDVSLEKHRPNKEKYPVGRAHEPSIKIQIGEFTKKIEEKIKANPDLFKKLRGGKNGSGGSLDSPGGGLSTDFSESMSSQSSSGGGGEEYNHEFSSDTSTSLANIFNVKSVTYIKIIMFFMFLCFLGILTLEFVFGFIHMQSIRNRINNMHSSYKLLNNMVYIKYFITEAVLANEVKDYIMIRDGIGYNKEEYITKMKNELAEYRQEFTTIYNEFTSGGSFSNDYTAFTKSKFILIQTISNGEEMPENQPFSTAINRIPTTVFYVSTISDSSLILNMTDRSCYELMQNLLNNYFLCWRNVTNILANDAKIGATNSSITTILFALSFIVAAIVLIIFWKLLNNFIKDREKPINLFLTIKKKIFEDLKNSSESFSNKLLNKFFGNEDNEEESQKGYETNIKLTDINIVKFKSPNEYKSTVNKSHEHLFNFIKLVIFFIILEGYMTFKYCYSDTTIKNISKFNDVFNVTEYSHIDTVLSVDILKSYFFDNKIPILGYNITNNKNYFNNPFITTFYNITERFEKMFISTSTTNSFLKGKYKEQFQDFLYVDFIDLFKMKQNTIASNDLLLSFNNGFKPISLNLFETLRFFTLRYLNDIDLQVDNGYSPIINNKKWIDLDYILIDIIRPWYNNLLDLMDSTLENFVGSAKVVYIAVYITFMVIVVLAYCIIWKSYEEKLKILLKRSFDLINLIPEEIKYLIVCKLNE